MATDSKLSTLIEQQLPDFVRSEGSNFVAFLKAYYEWMEETGNVTERTKNLIPYRDVDRTLDEFITYFHSEFMPSLPEDILIDPRTFVKHAKDLYRARGTENAYRLLFRILFDEEIEFYYPGIDILRASDGRWIKHNIIRVYTTDIHTDFLDDYKSQTIIGSTSDATAFVENIIQITLGSVSIIEFYVTKVEGEFVENEFILLKSDKSGLSESTVRVFGAVDNVTINVAGQNHEVGDRIDLVSSIRGFGANGVVTSITDKSIEFFIQEAGSRIYCC